jgi:hypothetical protein
MGRKNRKANPARAFADALESNEGCMGEMAAMAFTCEQFGISEEAGYELLISLSEEDANGI